MCLCLALVIKNSVLKLKVNPVGQLLCIMMEGRGNCPRQSNTLNPELRSDMNLEFMFDMLSIYNCLNGTKMWFIAVNLDQRVTSAREG